MILAPLKVEKSLPRGIRIKNHSRLDYHFDSHSQFCTRRKKAQRKGQAFLGNAKKA